jgi:hypothetical protein
MLTPTSAQSSSHPDLEAIIAQNYNGFYQVGLAFSAIRDRNLYKQEGFRSFAGYLRARWEIGRAHAYRKIACAKVIDNLSPIEDNVILPANEAQTRPITPLDPHV